MAQAEVKKLMDELGAAVVIRAQRNLGASRKVNGKNRRSVASGNLKESLTFKNQTRYGNPILLFTAEGTAKEYAQYVHDGRRPGAKPPPISPIEQWIKIKGIRPRDPKTKKFLPMTYKNRKGDTVSRTLGMAIAMSKSIGIKGIPANPYFSDALETELELRGPEFLEAMTKDLDARLNLR